MNTIYKPDDLKIGDEFTTYHAKWVESLLACIKELEAMTTWQPIETCPEGEYVLVTNGKLIDRARFYYQAEDDSYVWSSVFYTITHWMPLPKPPTNDHDTEMLREGRKEDRLSRGEE